MPAHGIRLLFVCLFATFALAQTSSALAHENHDQRPSVLILNSYSFGSRWSENTMRGVKETLLSAHKRIKLYIEYMDTKHHTSDEYYEQLRHTYKEKYQDIKLDAILACDDNAFNFLERNRDDIFGEVPTIFCGVNHLEFHPTIKLTKCSGVNEYADVDATIKLMQKLHPEIERITVICDNTTTGRTAQKKVRKLARSYHGSPKISLITDEPMDEILKTTSALRKGDGVLFIVHYQDREGQTFDDREVIAAIAESCTVPIYGLLEFHLGEGIIGGKMTSAYQQGVEATRMLFLVLSGKPAGEIPIKMDSPNYYMFDYNRLMEFGIDPQSLPRGSIIKNHPKTFYYKYKQEIWQAAAVFTVLIALVFFLSVNTIRLRKTEAQLRHHQENLENMVRERTEQLEYANAVFKELSVRDPLTGLYNRREYWQSMERQISDGKRHGNSTACLMIDIDFFKKVNDTYGHAAGDMILKKFSAILQSTLRSSDIPCRYGGEEFSVIMPHSDIDSAKVLAERLRHEVQNSEFGEPKKSIRCTCSIGVCSTSIHPEVNAEKLTALADSALYKAKETGRNRVCICSAS